MTRGSRMAGTKDGPLHKNVWSPGANAMKPLVSILIPAYNAEKWLVYALQSALAQTWQRKEIIIVDDGSRDGTGELARRFASKEVLVVSTDNQGLSAAVNHAYRLCQGDYIQELDADDLLAPVKIETHPEAQPHCDSNPIPISSLSPPF